MLDCERPVCPHCHENKQQPDQHQKYWGISLDQDLVETIFSLYPEWFEEATALSMDRPDQQLLLLGGTNVVDHSSLQHDMGRNKESLKLRLMLRRPIAQLVEQGIIPSLKASPHFHEQRQKLERAKTGDLLKHKIQRRPDRQQLIKQHILEDTMVDPSLQDKQRQLKKARLADDLNDRLSHRPGPLELIKGNILQTDEKFAQAVKEGQITFKRTCEGQTLKHPGPRFVIEEDSNSDTALSPASTGTQDTGPFSPTVAPALTFSPVHSKSSSAAAKKKPKPKAPTTKTRTIKFHEYKGPPSAQKAPTPAPPPVATDPETSYDLLLHQQQVFLQWQLEWQHKYPHIILSATSPGLATDTVETTPADQCPPDSTTRGQPAKLEDMKVSDLKAELKRRNLPVSGSKPQLIERLKPALGEPPASPVPMEVGEEENNKEHLVRLQQKKIEKLQQELQRSQLQLQQQLQQTRPAKTLLHNANSGTASQAVKANLAAFLQSHQHQQNSRPIVFYPATVNSLVDGAKPQAVSLLNNRAASLPNFTILSPSPVMLNNNSDSPPPSYNEATKRLNRFSADHLLNSAPSTNEEDKVHAIDDVIEILIKNGELPPSAADSPPSSPQQLEDTSPSLFQTSEDKASPSGSSSFGPLGSPPNTPLDFQLGLDMEAMDIGLERPAALFDPLDMELSELLSQPPSTPQPPPPPPLPRPDPDPLLSAAPFDFFSLVEEMDFTKGSPTLLNWDYSS